MSFKLEIVTPKGIYFSKEVDSLTVKLTTGYRTILSHHAPLIGALAYDEMHIYMGMTCEHYALFGGVINVTNEKTILLVNAIEHEKDIDLARAELAKKRAEDRLNEKHPGLDVKRAQLALSRAMARINTVNSAK